MIEIDNQKMDLNLLFVFYEIYKFQSVSKAALSLNLSQSAVSHSLKKLRHVFSDELFIRNGNKISATIKAHKIFNQLDPLIDLLRESIYQTIDFQPETSTRTFKIAMMDITEIIMLPRVLNYLLKHKYQLSVQVVSFNTETLYQDLNEGKIDIVVGSFNDIHPDLYRKRLFEHEFVVIEHAKNDHGTHAELSQAQFLQRQHIVVCSSSDATFSKMALEPFGLKRTYLLEINNYLPLPWLLFENDCIATIPQGLSKILSTNMKLNTYALNWFANEFSVDMIWSARVNKDPAIFWLVNLIYDLMVDVRNKKGDYQNIF